MLPQHELNSFVLKVLYYFTQESLRPHEKRALNFLVNEYLLKNGYRMTSITFSDENADQVWSMYSLVFMYAMLLFVELYVLFTKKKMVFFVL